MIRKAESVLSAVRAYKESTTNIENHLKEFEYLIKTDCANQISVPKLSDHETKILGKLGYIVLHSKAMEDPESIIQINTKNSTIIDSEVRDEYRTLIPATKMVDLYRNMIRLVEFVNFIADRIYIELLLGKTDTVSVDACDLPVGIEYSDIKNLFVSSGYKVIECPAQLMGDREYWVIGISDAVLQAPQELENSKKPAQDDVYDDDRSFNMAERTAAIAALKTHAFKVITDDGDWNFEIKYNNMLKLPTALRMDYLIDLNTCEIDSDSLDPDEIKQIIIDGLTFLREDK